SIIVRYFFASGSAYIVAMLPVFAMLANVSGAPLMLTALALLFSNSYGGMVTHYGGWNTLIWYGGIIGLSSLLSKVKFFEWLAEVFKNNLA
ncbi:anion permease, partial [Shigella sonnei]|nr:anion permease [Shigella sonnei]